MREYHQQQGFNPVNVQLSFRKIRDFTNALSPEVFTGGLVKKKKMADRALEHLDSYFDARDRDVMTFGRCGGTKPRIP
ncbi:MAG: hypothetical protein JSV88_16955 [Candidatus Aminicenantes bacterium]|nr:MAG: hypothetical protein JSV88_16955 [Candidatus Aminicenantes bacterium]